MDHLEAKLPQSGLGTNPEKSGLGTSLEQFRFCDLWSHRHIRYGIELLLRTMSTPVLGQERQIRTPDELGNVISELRSLRRKTQFEVASALGIDRSQLAHLEGGRSGRYLAHLLNILEHLGADLQIHWPTNDAANPAAVVPLSKPKLLISAPEPSLGPAPKPTVEAEPEAPPEAPHAQIQPILETVPKTASQPQIGRNLEPDFEPVPEPVPEPINVDLEPVAMETDMAETAVEPISAQLKKIANQAMNVMAASQQLSVPRATTERL